MDKLFCGYGNLSERTKFVNFQAGLEGAEDLAKMSQPQSIPLRPEEQPDAITARMGAGRIVIAGADAKLTALRPHEAKAPGDEGQDFAASAASERARWPSDIQSNKADGKITSGRYVIEEGRSDIRFRAADGSVIAHLGAGKKVNIQDGAKYDVGGVTFVKATYKGKEGYIADNFLSPVNSSVEQSSTVFVQASDKPPPSLPASDAELIQLVDKAVQSGQWWKELRQTDEVGESAGGKT